MEETEVRKWLEDNNYTAYEIHKEVSLSLQGIRSEEHTSELQSPVVISYAVFCLKKKKEM